MRSHARIATAALLASLLLSGCASLSESQCMAGDWQTVGYRDGLAGHQSAQLLTHQNACGKHGVVPDRTAYLNGWEEGVDRYCQPTNGFLLGERGAGYTNVCPVHQQAAFYSAYQEGRQLHLANVEITQLNRSITEKTNRLKSIAAERSSAEAALVDDTTSAHERRELLDLTRELTREEGQLQAEIQEQKIDVALKTERLKLLRESLIASY